jgi:hypothetical protein
MFNHSQLVDQLTRQRTTELHDAASRGRLAGRNTRLPRTRAYAGRMLIGLGTRIAPTETRATNRVTKLAPR